MRGLKKAKKVLAYELGRSGEDVATEYLKKKKYKIVDKGFRFLRGEIDIIAYDDETLVFVEVKTRKSTRFNQPEESVTPAKRKQLRRVAQGYLLRNHIQDVECRFDVLSLTFDELEGYTVKHFTDAF
ncbi:MAG TPA: YraN family protein [Candidatus Heimdallarchaeota archaeon]|jgi:putative endonuclease|nr:YraN family protein [Candidatus Heimdallarchaeota archaeon]